MYNKSDIGQMFSSLNGGYKLKLKDQQMWIDLPKTENTEAMIKLFFNPNSEFSFTLFNHDVELHQVKFNNEGLADRIRKQADDMLKKARGEY